MTTSVNHAKLIITLLNFYFISILLLTMSKYDQRMLNIKSNILYFQLIPKSLTTVSPCQHTFQQLTFTLIKGQHIIEKSKRPVSLINNGCIGTISHVFINFDVCCNQHQYTNQQYRIIVHGSSINQMEVGYEQGQVRAEVFFQVGSFRIPVNDYIAQFLESGKTLFRQRFTLNKQLTLDMQIHTQRIRFMLQKNVRQNNHHQHIKSSQKQQKYIEIRPQQTQVDKKSTNNQNLIIIQPRTKNQQIQHKDNSPTEEKQHNQSHCYEIAQEDIQEMICDQFDVDKKICQGGQREGEEGNKKQEEQVQVQEQSQKQTKFLEKECSQENVQSPEQEQVRRFQEQVHENQQQNEQTKVKEQLKIQEYEPEQAHLYQQKQPQQHGQTQVLEQLIQEHQRGQGQEQKQEPEPEPEDINLSRQQQRQQQGQPKVQEQVQIQAQVQQKKQPEEHENVQYREQQHRQTKAAQNQQQQEQRHAQAQAHEFEEISKESNLLKQDQHEGQQQQKKDKEQKQQEQEKVIQMKKQQRKLKLGAKQNEKDELLLNEDKQRMRLKKQQKLEAENEYLLNGKASSEKMSKQQKINKRPEQIKRKDEKKQIPKKEANILKKQIKKKKSQFQ